MGKMNQLLTAIGNVLSLSQKRDELIASFDPISFMGPSSNEANVDAGQGGFDVLFKIAPLINCTSTACGFDASTGRCAPRRQRETPDQSGVIFGFGRARKVAKPQNSESKKAFWRRLCSDRNAPKEPLQLDVEVVITTSFIEATNDSVRAIDKAFHKEMKALDEEDPRFELELRWLFVCRAL
ncbi:hypothetical protein HDU90_003102 [Geranomyces variabilis]|nr:hypothetical protein HDU90_003102 [Geranomyces variabilis]